MHDVMNWKYFSINNSEFLDLNIKIKVTYWIVNTVVQGYLFFNFNTILAFFFLVVGNMLIPIVICEYCIPSFHVSSPFEMEWSECVMCLNNRNWFYTAFRGWILTQACLSSIPFYFLSHSWYLWKCHKGWRNFLKFFIWSCVAKQSSKGNSSFEGLLQTSDWMVYWVLSW